MSMIIANMIWSELLNIDLKVTYTIRSYFDHEIELMNLEHIPPHFDQLVEAIILEKLKRKLNKSLDNNPGILYNSLII